MRRILVLRGGALGDFIVTLPALALLRERWPDARIELAGNATAAALARRDGLLDAVHSQHEARWSALYGVEPLPAAFDAWLREFDLVVNYWPDPDGTLARRFPLRDAQLFLSGAAMPARAPAAAHYLEPLRAIGLHARENFYLFPNTHRPMPSVRARIAIHPGSGSPRKNWPAENWVALMTRLPADISLMLGEVELPRWQHAATHPLRNVNEFAASVTPLVMPPLESLVEHFSQCRLFLGHDSGISHLAAACGVPCVLLFGPTDPQMWAPPASHVRVLRREPNLASISVEEVLAAVTSALADQT